MVASAMEFISQRRISHEISNVPSCFEFPLLITPLQPIFCLFSLGNCKSSLASLLYLTGLEVLEWGCTWCVGATQRGEPRVPQGYFIYERKLFPFPKPRANRQISTFGPAP